MDTHETRRSALVPLTGIVFVILTVLSFVISGV